MATVTGADFFSVRPKNALHPERYYPHARIRVFHHSAPEIPETAFIFPMLRRCDVDPAGFHGYSCAEYLFGHQGPLAEGGYIDGRGICNLRTGYHRTGIVPRSQPKRHRLSCRIRKRQTQFQLVRGVEHRQSKVDVLRRRWLHEAEKQSGCKQKPCKKVERADATAEKRAILNVLYGWISYGFFRYR